MYVEVLSKQLMKPCIQTQELKLVKEHGVSRYLIMTSDDAELDAGSTVVTKQNNDGTISLTTVKDMKMESETVITQANEPEENQEEIYSCNTCGVSFTSVLEHIQNFHNDQDVVVEEPMDDMDNTEANPVAYESSIPSEDSTMVDKQMSRRMITETGDIIEAPILLKTATIGIAPDQMNKIQPQLKEEVMDKAGRIYTRRYVQIDKFCDSVVKNIKQPDEKNGPYHKVVIKEIESTTAPGEKVKVFHCMSCNIYVSALEQFKLHPCKTPKYSCPHCPVSYENSKSLCAHMKVHKTKTGAATTGTPPIFECEVCNTIFPTNKSLKLHKRMHDPTKVRPIEPPVETADGSEVSKDKFICSVCSKVIPIDYRDIHQKSHKMTNNFNCDICNKKFHSSEYLEMHMSVHNLDKVSVSKQDKSLPYTCLYCERRFARPHEKVKHERIHTGEKPHSCEICGKSFRVSYCLTLHMRTHTGARPYACPHCGKRFKAHSVYNHHLLTHSEVRAYKCPYCPKAFKTSVQLAGHKNSHTKPFACQHCNRPFASLYQLRVHTETHARQNNLKFSCSMCGASYARAFALKDHIKQVHNRDADKVDSLTVLKEDEWIIRENVEADTEELQVNKSLPREMKMEIINTNQLIVPN
ncbi:zinc finger protein 2-like isoform X2 [Hyposmocoma kahamanoa]|nr:zinc finger protein 2-like isoform X2 [Hyposmocoma kahamanoa]